MSREERLDYINNKQDYIAFYMTLPARTTPRQYTLLERIWKLVKSV